MGRDRGTGGLIESKGLGFYNPVMLTGGDRISSGSVRFRVSRTYTGSLCTERAVALMAGGVGKQTERVHGARWMGLDVGDRTIGVALSDELGWTAQPFTTLRRKRLDVDLDGLRRIGLQYGVSAVVVGMPLSMNGMAGSRARRVQTFASALEGALEVRVVFWDERLSTVAAERVLLQADLSRTKRREHVDKVAAAIILQGYLDSVRERRES